jgi:hypothetical protein
VFELLRKRLYHSFPAMVEELHNCKVEGKDPDVVVVQRVLNWSALAAEIVSKDVKDIFNVNRCLGLCSRVHMST